MTEEWRPVPDFEGIYEVSNEGRIRSLTRLVTHRNGYTQIRRGRVLSPWTVPDGYRDYALCDGDRVKRVRVHRVVAQAFLGPRLPGQVVRHLDGNPANNCLENLAYGSHADNIRDSVRHGTHHLAKKTHCKHGHEFTPENTWRDRSGHRQCAECTRRIKRESVRRARAQKRAMAA